MAHTSLLSCVCHTKWDQVVYLFVPFSALPVFVITLQAHFPQLRMVPTSTQWQQMVHGLGTTACSRPCCQRECGLSPVTQHSALHAGIIYTFVDEDTEAWVW